MLKGSMTSSSDSPSRASPELSQRFLLRYAFAVGSIALATWVRVLVDPVLGDQSPFPTLLFAVLLTAWYGGVRPALVAVLLGVLSADYFLLLPRGSFWIKGAAQYVDLALFIGVSVGVAVLGGVMHDAPLGTIRKLQQAREALAQSEERLRLTLRSSGSPSGVGKSRRISSRQMRTARSCSAFRRGSSHKRSRGLPRWYTRTTTIVSNERYSIRSSAAQNTTRNSGWCGPKAPCGPWLPAEKSMTATPGYHTGSPASAGM